MVTGFNGAEVSLRATSDSLGSFQVDNANTYEAKPSDVISEGGDATKQSDQVRVPVVEERLKVSISKEPYVKEEFIVKKKPVTETRKVKETISSERVKVIGIDED